MFSAGQIDLRASGRPRQCLDRRRVGVIERGVVLVVRAGPGAKHHPITGRPYKRVQAAVACLELAAPTIADLAATIVTHVAERSRAPGQTGFQNPLPNRSIESRNALKPATHEETPGAHDHTHRQSAVDVLSAPTPR
jgi:hypothetical protein